MKSIFKSFNTYCNHCKIEKILRALIYILAFFSLISIPIFTYVPKLNLITNLICLSFSAISLLYLVFIGKIYLSRYIVYLSLFWVYCFAITCFSTFQFEKIWSMLTLYSYSIFIFEIALNFKNYNYFFFSMLFGVMILSTFFIGLNIDKILALDFERFGDEFGNANSVGLFFSVGVAISSFYIVKKKKWFFFLLFPLFIFFLCSIFTGSKTSIIQCFIVVALSLYFMFPKKKKIYYYLSLVAFVGAFIGIFQIEAFKVYKDRFIQMFDAVFGLNDAKYSYSTLQRRMMILDGLYYWSKNAIFGNGSESFVQLTSYGAYSHSTISEILCNFGLIGSFLFFKPFVSLLRKENNVLKHLNWISFVTFLVFGSFTFIIFISKYVMIFLTVMQASNLIENNNLEKENNFCLKISERRLHINFSKGDAI